MPVTGQDVIAKNIVAYGGRFLETVDKTMIRVSNMLNEKVTINISLTDHTLAELAKMDHPYARRHGPEGKHIHDPYYQVHEQSGRLRSSRRSGIIPSSLKDGRLQATAYMGLDEKVAPHALHVVFGTSKMIPRPVLEGSRDSIVTEAKNIISTTLRDMNYQFKGKP